MKFSTWLNGLTADASPSATNDYVVTYDASATTSKKVTLANLASAMPVAACYTTAAAQSIDNASFEIVDFGTSVYDTHSAVTTGASWKFTVPTGEGGKYSVKASIMYVTTTAFAITESTTMALYVNGAAVAYIDRYQPVATGVDHNVFLRGATDLLLSAADYVDLRLHQSSGGGLAMFNDAKYNRIAIHKIH